MTEAYTAIISLPKVVVFFFFGGGGQFFIAVIYTYVDMHILRLDLHCSVNIYSDWLREQFCNCIYSVE